MSDGLLHLMLEDLVPLMDEQVGLGEKFCPVIFNIDHAGSNRLAVKDVMPVMTGIIRRIGQVIIIDSRPEEALLSERVVRRFLKTLIPLMTFVESYNKALHILGLEDK